MNIKNDDNVLSDERVETRGRLITCKYCKSKFQLYGEEKDQWKKLKYPCPTCGEIYCILPPTEKELRLLQEEYQKTKNKKTFNQMIKLFYSYTESLIKKHFSNRLTFEGALEYYTHNSVTKFVEYYLKDSDFTVGISFAGLLMHKIRETIFSKKEKPSAPISLDFEFDDGNTVEYQDTKKSELDIIEDEENKKIKNYIKIKKLEMEEQLLTKELELIQKEVGMTDEQIKDDEMFKGLMDNLMKRSESNTKSQQQEKEILDSDSGEGYKNEFNFEEAKNNKDYQGPLKDEKFGVGDEIKIYVRQSDNEEIPTLEKEGDDYKGTTAYVYAREEGDKENELRVGYKQNDEGNTFTIDKGRVITTKKLEEEKSKEEKPKEEENKETEV